jgi:hypothetical protein
MKLQPSPKAEYDLGFPEARKKGILLTLLEKIYRRRMKELYVGLF